MGINRVIDKAVQYYNADGTVKGVHVEGMTPTLYSDGTAANGEAFGLDFDPTTIRTKWQALYPNDDPDALATKQATVLAAVIADKLAKTQV